MEQQRRIELQEAFAILQESLIDAGKIPTKYCPLSKQNILDVAMKYCRELQNCDETFQEQKQILQQRNEELAGRLQQLQRQAVKQEWRGYLKPHYRLQLRLLLITRVGLLRDII